MHARFGSRERSSPIFWSDCRTDGKATLKRADEPVQQKFS